MDGIAEMYHSDLWESAFSTYAKNAKSKVYYIHPENVYGNMYLDVEKDISDELIRKGIATEIMQVFK